MTQIARFPSTPTRRWLIRGLAAALIAAPASAQPDGAAPPSDPATVLLESLSHPQEQGRFAPRDDCAAVPGAAEFRHELADAVIRGDAEGVAALASPDVKLGFGGDDGRDRFLAQLQDPASELMDEIARLLPLGCSVNEEGDLSAPWYFSQDMGDIDGYAATIVTGEDVPVFAEAEAASPIRKRVSWDLVELNDGLYPERPFQQVTMPGGAKGFVATGSLRSLLDYRLLASREDGEWKITAILAGD